MTEAEAKKWVGDYYGVHDGCLYRITLVGGKLHQSRCNTPGAIPAEDKFSDPYELAEGQLQRQVSFGNFERVDPAPPDKRAPLTLFDL